MQNSSFLKGCGFGCFSKYASSYARKATFKFALTPRGGSEVILIEFCKMETGKNGDGIEVTVEAKSFLHRQVRSIVGSLVEVGRGARGEDWIADILEARDRTACGPVAPADGLFLERVEYGAP